MEDVKDGCLGNDEFLQVLGVELVAVHVDSREEDALHLIMSQFVSGLVGSYQHLPGPESDTGMFTAVEGGKFGETVGQFVG